MLEPRPHRSRKGFSLTEMAIVLAVVGLILGAIWVAASSVILSNRTRTATEQLVRIASNVRAIATEQGGLTGGTTSNINQALDQLKAFPLELRQKGGTAGGIIFNNWSEVTSTNGGGFQVGSIQVYADNCQGSETATTPQPCFGVTYLNLPQYACLRLAMEGGDTLTGLQRVMINGTVVGDGGGTPPFPVSPANAQLGCTNTSNQNTVNWIYLVQDAK